MSKGEGQHFEQGGPVESEKNHSSQRRFFLWEGHRFWVWVTVLSYGVCLEPCAENSKIVPDLLGRNTGID